MVYNRNILDCVLTSLRDTPVVVINGARQTGKTTLCERLLIDAGVEAQFITLDDPSLLSAATRNPVGFLEGLAERVIIDEIQRAPELLLGIKRLVDQDRKSRRFILTGSADIMTLPRISDSLAGRTEVHILWPLSQGEIRGRRENFIERVFSDDVDFSGASKIKWDDLCEIMAAGGYPSALERRDDIRRQQWGDSYITAILEKDIRDLSNVEGLTELPNLLALLATRVGSLLNFSDISRLAQMPASTFKRYYTLLKRVFMIVDVPAWTANVEGRLVKSPKLYLNDTGILCYLRRIGVADLKIDKTAAGHVLENFVVMELLKQLGWAEPFVKMHHFRSQGGQEVDVVFEGRNRKVVGVEIKSTASVSHREFQGLNVLKKLANDRFHLGVVLYTGDQVVKFDDKMWAVPLSALWS